MYQTIVMLIVYTWCKALLYQMQEQQHSVPMVIKSMRYEQCDELYFSKQIGRVWNDIKKDVLIARNGRSNRRRDTESKEFSEKALYMEI